MGAAPGHAGEVSRRGGEGTGTLHVPHPVGAQPREMTLGRDQDWMPSPGAPQKAQGLGIWLMLVGSWGYPHSAHGHGKCLLLEWEPQEICGSLGFEWCDVCPAAPA